MNVQEIELNNINTDLIVNCRKNANVDELVESIKDSGVQIPVGVCAQENGQYGLVYGFRRYTACIELGMERIPAQIMESYGEAKLLVMNLQENVSRKNLTPMEEALAVQRIINAGLDVDEFRSALGWSKTIITQRLALLELSMPIKVALEKDTISVGQARAIQDAEENHHDELIELAEKGCTAKSLKEEVDSLSSIKPIEDDSCELVLSDDDDEKYDFDKELDKEDAKALAEANSNLIKSHLLDCGAKVLKDQHAWFAFHIAVQSIEFDRLPKAELGALVNATQSLSGEQGLDAWGEAAMRK